MILNCTFRWVIHFESEKNEKIRAVNLNYWYRCVKKLLLVLFMGLIVPVSLTAQEYKIVGIRAYLSNDSLKIEFAIDNLLEGDVRKTVLAGLPLAMEFSFELLNSQQKQLINKNIRGRITYNVWEEYFLMEVHEAGKKQFFSLPELERWMQTVRGIGLAPAALLNAGESYRVKVHARIFLLTREQSRELKWWLQRSEPVEEELPSRERSTGFKLNLNRIVQLFFSTEERQKEYTADGRSGVFRLSDLKSR